MKQNSSTELFDYAKNGSKINAPIYVRRYSFDCCATCSDDHISHDDMLHFLTYYKRFTRFSYRQRAPKCIAIIGFPWENPIEDIGNPGTNLKLESIGSGGPILL